MVRIGGTEGMGPIEMPGDKGPSEGVQHETQPPPIAHLPRPDFISEGPGAEDKVIQGLAAKAFGARMMRGTPHHVDVEPSLLGAAAILRAYLEK